MLLIADPNSQREMIPIFRQYFPRYLGKHTFCFSANGVEVGTFRTVFVKLERPIVDVKEVKSHD